MALQATVSMSWVNTVLDAAQRLGSPRPKVMAAAGLGLGELERERWPIDHITRLWHAAVQCTQDPSFGLKAGAVVGPASFNVVSYILQSAPTLRGAFSSVQQFQRLISDGGRFQFIAGETTSWVVYHPRQGVLAFSPHQLEAVLAAVVSFCRWVTGTEVTPLRAQFSHAAVGPLAGYRSALHCPVDFEQAFSGLLLSNELLDRPLPQADAQLASVHRQYAQARLAVLSASGNLLEPLRQWVTTQLQGSVPTRDQAALAFGLTPRTLCRHLKAEGFTYRGLVDAARKQAALEAVSQSTRPFADIAHSLGFAEASVFNRAFKRWSAATPGQWRQRTSNSI